MTTRDRAFEKPAEALGYVDIDPRELDALADARLVDVREPHEYEGELCRIPGAELVPLASLERVARSWDRSKRIVLICRSGRRSAQGATLLAQLGFRQLFNLRGGMQAYRAAALPTECGPCRR
jgi:rhodanese-related sulfurtransferase